MSKSIILLLFSGALFMAGAAHARYPVYADGDLAPLGAPDGLINSADLLIASRITLHELTPTELELSHGDIYPPGVPDGVINLQDLLLLQLQVLSATGNHYVERLDLFADGPATLSSEFNGISASTTVEVGGWTGPGATVTNNPNYTDPADPYNTVLYFSSSGGTANLYLGTSDLSSDPVLDTGFDFSGTGSGRLVFDIRVNNITDGAILTVKMDSGWPNVGQVALSASQYSVGEWRRVSIDFSELLANPDPLGSGLDLDNVVNAMVLEVSNGDANFYLDNIFVTHACPEVGACHASINTKDPGPGGPLTFSEIGPNSANVSFTTTPASAATVNVRLLSDSPSSPPLVTIISPAASDHSVRLTGLWAAAAYTIEVSNGQEVATEIFQTADPAWSSGACRSGPQALPLDGGATWTTYTDSNGAINVSAAAGCNGLGSGAQMSFDLGDGEWVVASGDDFAAPLDLSAYTHLWVPFRGTAGVSTSFEIKLRDVNGNLSVARVDNGTGLPVWRSWAVDLRELRPQLGSLDLSAITALEVAFSAPLGASGPRSGVVELGKLSAWNIASEQPAVSGFERVNRDETAMAAVASDLLARQRPHGFIPAWFELAPNWHVYANAMALIVFTLEYERLDAAGDPAAAQYENAARLVADTLVSLQALSARGGAWDDSYVEVADALALHPEYARVEWVGSTAWAGISLVLARDILPQGEAYDAAISAAATFYANRQGCRTTAGLPAGSLTEGTEGNISSHLFLQAAAARGLGATAVPDALASFIADTLYDPAQQRFYCGVEVDFADFNASSCTGTGSGAILRGDARSCLDVIGNWGSEWLVRQGRVSDALGGLSYARYMFPVQAFGDAAAKGLGDIAGPWTPSVEIGAGQWAVAGGPDASFVLAQAQAHLCQLGACQGAADNFSTGIGWNTTAHGIAPAAWMYLAWHGGFWESL